MKAQIEINFADPENGVIFLNFWDSWHGNDVVCEVVNGELMRTVHDEDEDAPDLPPQKITILEFIEAVKQSIESRKP